MAITVKTGGTFTTGQDGQRPGLYVRFIEKAIAAIGLGARSKVATIKKVYAGDAEMNKVYRVTGMAQAIKLFGAENVKDIEYFFIGGASEVVVATSNTTGDAAAVTETLNVLETYDFHVFCVQPGYEDLEDAAFTWTVTARNNGKNFVSVFASGADEKVASIKTKLTGFKDENSVFVANGVKDNEGTAVPAEFYACYVAGVIAGTALDGSLTYKEVPFSDVITRYRSTEITELLAEGALLTVMDGDQPRIEQGLTLGEGQFSKIRTVRAKQAMIDDIDKAINDNYIGKITNNPDGQIAVINAIKTYLDTLANANVIAKEFVVELDKTVPSVGSELYINIGVKFLDSIEYIYLTVTL
jgi:Phage tail sheath C-terminal domain/Phage tail sheath protein subtilisin-like domain